jgi:hypothetical protein
MLLVPAWGAGRGLDTTPRSGKELLGAGKQLLSDQSWVHGFVRVDFRLGPQLPARGGPGVARECSHKVVEAPVLNHSRHEHEAVGKVFR